MSQSAVDNELQQVASTATSRPSPPPRRPLGLVRPTIMVLIFWIVTEASYQVEAGMFYRFITRFIVLLVLLGYFLVWGLTRRHFTFSQRLLALGSIVGCGVIAGALGHPATGMFATGMIGLPIVITLSVGWLWLTRQRPARVELAGVAMASVLVFGVISLLRWDGVDGRQRNQLSWRWMPTPEQRFLSQKSATAAVPLSEEKPALEETEADWTSFRGGPREGVVPGVTLGDWTAALPREAWRRRIGPGWSSVIAVGDVLFTQEQRGDREAVVCYDARTGNEVWSHSAQSSSERFDETLSGTGPRATPAFGDNRIYAYGAKGRFECLDATTGEPRWSHNLFEMTGAAVPQWGSATSPTIVDDLVIVFAGGKDGNSLLAFDRASGDQRWQAPGGTVSYSSPQVFTIAGERQVVMHDDAGLSGYRIENGEQLWHHASPHSGSFQPMVQPHQLDANRFLVNWDAGLLCLTIMRAEDKYNIEELWTSNRLKPSFNDFFIHDGFIYGLDDGILCCVDLNGKRLWKRGRYGFGQLLLLPDVHELLVLTEGGDVVRVAADPQQYRELGQFTALHSKTWNHPLIAHGRLVVRNGEEMACYELSPGISTAAVQYGGK